MKLPVAIALYVLLSVGGSSMAAEPPQSESETSQDAGAAEGTADPLAASPQKADPSPTATEPADEESPAMDVNRHRPGACPEGPPCKGDD